MPMLACLRLKWQSISIFSQMSCRAALRAKGRENRSVRPNVLKIAGMQRVIEASPAGDQAYLVSAYDKLFTAAGFGNPLPQ